MRTILKFSLRAAVILVVVAAVVGFWKREEISRLLAVSTLFSEEKIVANFSHMDSAFLSQELDRGTGPVSDLPQGDPMDLPGSFDTWLSERAVTALVVMKDGKIRHESYHKGTGDTDRRISWSVAKSFLSALMGVIVEQGAIASLDDPVEIYAPSLIGGAYEGATVRNVLNMASGVTFDEDYLDQSSDINKMGRVLALGRSMDGFAAGLEARFTSPGAQWQYVSIDTHVIGMVIRGATGRSIHDLVEEYIVDPMGFEAAPYYLTDGYGVAFVLGGLNLRTRDYARFGQMFLQKGLWGDRQIVPARWVTASTRPSAPTAAGEVQYGYQWWIPSDAPEGEYFARGIYGQYIYIDETRGVVIAANGADRGFREDGSHDQNLAMFRTLAASLE